MSTAAFTSTSTSTSTGSAGNDKLLHSLMQTDLVSSQELQRQLLVKLEHLYSNVCNNPDASIIAQVRLFHKHRLDLFRSDRVVYILKSILKTSTQQGQSKQRANINKTCESTLHYSAASILFSLYKASRSWPLELLELFLDDALGCRNWVDAPESQPFINNLLFWTKTINNIDKKLYRSTKSKSSAVINMCSSEDENEVDVEGDLMQEDIADRSISPDLRFSMHALGSNVVMIDTIPDVCNRYENNIIDALDLSLSVLYSRTSNPQHSVSPSILASYQCFLPSILSLCAENATSRFASSSSSSSFIDNTRSVCNSYLLGSNQGQLWTLHCTLSLFSEINEIKILCINCLESWFGHAAVTDHARKLVISLISSIEGSANSSSLGTVDSHLLECLVRIRLRSQSNPSDTEKREFFGLNHRIPLCASIIIFTLLYEDVWISNGVLKSDSVKLICQLLSSSSSSSTTSTSTSTSTSNERDKSGVKECFIKDLLKVDNSLDSNLDSVIARIRVSGSLRGVEATSIILAKAICLFTNIHDNKSNSSSNNSNVNVSMKGQVKQTTPAALTQQSGGSSTGIIRRLDKPWDMTASKNLCDAIVRIIRTLGAHEFDYVTFHKSVYTITNNDINWVFSHSSRLFDHEIMVFYSDLSLVTQLLITSEICSIEKETAPPLQAAKPPNKVSAVPTSSNNKPLLIHSNSILSSSKSAATTSSLFATSSMASKIAQQRTAASVNSDFNSSASSSNSLLPLDARKRVCLCEILVMQELFAEWIGTSIRNHVESSSEDADVQLLSSGAYRGPMHLPAIQRLSKRSTSIIDYLSRVFNVASSYSTSKFKVEVDNSSHAFLHDFGLVSDVLIDSLIDVCEFTSVTPSEVIRNMGLIEAIIYRGCHTQSEKGMKTIDFNSNLNIVNKLFALSQIKLFPPHSSSSIGISDNVDVSTFHKPRGRPRKDAGNSNSIGNSIICTFNPLSLKSQMDKYTYSAVVQSCIDLPGTHSNINKRVLYLSKKPSTTHLVDHEGADTKSNNATAATKTEYIPKLAHKKIYWRVCVILYLLSSAQPLVSSVGLQLWDEVPNVQSLMLMSMSERFFYPPTASSVEMAAEALEGSFGSYVASFAASDSKNAIPSHNIDLFCSSISNSSVSASNSNVTSTNYLQPRSRSPKYTNVSINNPSNSSSICFDGSSDSNSSSSNYDNSNVNSNKCTRKFDTRFLPSVGYLSYYVDNNEIDLLVTQDFVQVLRGRSGRVQMTLSCLEDKILEYLLEEYRIEVDDDDNDDNDNESFQRAKCRISGSKSRVTEDDEGRRGGDTSSFAHPVPSNRSLKRSHEETFEDSNESYKKIDASIAMSPAKSKYESNYENASHRLDQFEIPVLTELSSDPYITQYGQLPRQDIMLFNVIGAGRAPPEEVLQAVRGYHKSLKIGARLRSCVDPDFIAMAVVKGKSYTHKSVTAATAATSTTTTAAVVVESSKNSDERDSINSNIGWLLPAISVDLIGIIPRLPAVTSRHLLSMVCGSLVERINEFNFWSSGYQLEDKAFSGPTLGDIISVKNNILSQQAVGGSPSMGMQSPLDQQIAADADALNNISFLLALIYSNSDNLESFKVIVSLSLKLLTGLLTSVNGTNLMEAPPEIGAACDSENIETFIKFFISDLSSDNYSRRDGCRMAAALLNNIMFLAEHYSLGEVNGHSNRSIGLCASLNSLSKLWFGLLDDKPTSNCTSSSNSSATLSSISSNSNQPTIGNNDRKKEKDREKDALALNDMIDIIVTPVLLDGPYRHNSRYAASATEIARFAGAGGVLRAKFGMFSGIFQYIDVSDKTHELRDSSREWRDKSTFLCALEKITNINRAVLPIQLQGNCLLSSFRHFSNAIEVSLRLENNQERIVGSLSDLKHLLDQDSCDAIVAVRAVLSIYKRFKLHFMDKLISNYKFIASLVMFSLRSIIRSLSKRIPLGEFILIIANETTSTMSGRSNKSVVDMEGFLLLEVDGDDVIGSSSSSHLLVHNDVAAFLGGIGALGLLSISKGGRSVSSYLTTAATATSAAITTSASDSDRISGDTRRDDVELLRFFIEDFDGLQFDQDVLSFSNEAFLGHQFYNLILPIFLMCINGRLSHSLSLPLALSNLGAELSDGDNNSNDMLLTNNNNYNNSNDNNILSANIVVGSELSRGAIPTATSASTTTIDLYYSPTLPMEQISLSFLIETRYCEDRRILEPALSSFPQTSILEFLSTFADMSIIFRDCLVNSIETFFLLHNFSLTVTNLDTKAVNNSLLCRVRSFISLLRNICRPCQSFKILANNCLKVSNGNSSTLFCSLIAEFGVSFIKFGKEKKKSKEDFKDIDILSDNQAASPSVASSSLFTNFFDAAARKSYSSKDLLNSDKTAFEKIRSISSDSQSCAADAILDIFISSQQGLLHTDIETNSENSSSVFVLIDVCCEIIAAALVNAENSTPLMPDNSDSRLMRSFFLLRLIEGISLAQFTDKFTQKINIDNQHMIISGSFGSKLSSGSDSNSSAASSSNSSKSEASIEQEIHKIAHFSHFRRSFSSLLIMMANKDDNFERFTSSCLDGLKRKLALLKDTCVKITRPKLCCWREYCGALVTLNDCLFILHSVVVNMNLTSFRSNCAALNEIFITFCLHFDVLVTSVIVNSGYVSSGKVFSENVDDRSVSRGRLKILAAVFDLSSTDNFNVGLSDLKSSYRSSFGVKSSSKGNEGILSNSYSINKHRSTYPPSYTASSIFETLRKIKLKLQFLNSFDAKLAEMWLITLFSSEVTAICLMSTVRHSGSVSFDRKGRSSSDDDYFARVLKDLFFKSSGAFLDLGALEHIFSMKFKASDGNMDSFSKKIQGLISGASLDKQSIAFLYLVQSIYSGTSCLRSILWRVYSLFPQVTIDFIESKSKSFCSTSSSSSDESTNYSENKRRKEDMSPFSFPSSVVGKRPIGSFSADLFLQTFHFCMVEESFHHRVMLKTLDGMNHKSDETTLMNEVFINSNGLLCQSERALTFTAPDSWQQQLNLNFPVEALVEHMSFLWHTICHLGDKSQRGGDEISPSDLTSRFGDIFHKYHSALIPLLPSVISTLNLANNPPTMNYNQPAQPMQTTQLSYRPSIRSLSTVADLSYLKKYPPNSNSSSNNYSNNSHSHIYNSNNTVDVDALFVGIDSGPLMWLLSAVLMSEQLGQYLHHPYALAQQVQGSDRVGNANGSGSANVNFNANINGYGAGNSSRGNTGIASSSGSSGNENKETILKMAELVDLVNSIKSSNK